MPKPRTTVDEHASTVTSARHLLLEWYPSNGRSFWWRRQSDPYRTALVEVLLRQTRAEPVEGTIAAFVWKYKEPANLASASLGDLENDLSSFGLQRQRAQQLKALADEIVRRGGEVPTSEHDLLQLPGIGPYSAAAIRCFAFGQPDAAVDTNVARIIGRLFGISASRGEPRRNKEIIRLSGHVVNRDRPQMVNWALIDLGSSLCRPRTPECGLCPLVRICSYAHKRHQ